MRLERAVAPARAVGIARYGARVIGLVIALIAVIGAGAAAWVVTAPRAAFASDDPSIADRTGDAGRGRLVFAAGDCASCHASPGQADRLRLGGGLALASPFGTLRVPNISQDPVDGIGRWRSVDLANAMLSGVSPAARHSVAERPGSGQPTSSQHYYPAFPYASYARMELADVVDLMAYLRTLPAVPGRPPQHELAFPFNIRRLVGFWKLVYLDRSPLQPVPGRSAQWHRGRYLVETVSHCAECHSSRNLIGGIRPETRFAGGRDPEGTGFAPNITPQALGRWSEADLAALLVHGRTPDLRQVGSSMAEVIENTRALPAEDRQAIAAYIKALPPRPTAAP